MREKERIIIMKKGTWKYITIPIIIMGIFIIIPFFIGSTLSTREIYAGISFIKSLSVGFENYLEIFDDISFDFMANALSIGLFSAVLGSIYVFAGVMGIGSVKNKWLKAVLLCIAVIPAALPETFMLLFGDSFLKVVSKNFFVFSVLYEAIIYGSVCIVGGVLYVWEDFNIKKVMKIAAGFALLRCMVLFSSDLAPNFIYGTELNTRTLMVQTYTHLRINGDYGYGSAINVFIGVIQIIPAILCGFGMKALFKNEGMSGIKSYDLYQEKKNYTPYFIAVLIPVLVAVVFLYAFSVSPNIPAKEWIYLINPFSWDFILPVILGGGFAVLAVTMAYGLREGQRGITALYSVFTALCTLFTLTWYMLKQVSNEHGILWTYLGSIPYIMFFVWIMFAAASGKQSGSFKEYIRQMLPETVMVAGVIFARLFGMYSMHPVYNINMYKGRFYSSAAVIENIPNAQYMVMAGIALIVTFAFIFAGTALKKTAEPGKWI